MSNPVPWLMGLFVPHSKGHEKTISFLEEAEVHRAINSHCPQIKLDKHHRQCKDRRKRSIGSFHV